MGNFSDLGISRCGSEVHGCDDSDVRHVLGHDSCCGPDYDAFPVPRFWKSWPWGARHGKSGKSGKIWWIHWSLWLVLASWIDFSRGKTRISTSKRMFFFLKIAAHGDSLDLNESCHRPIHHECSHHNIIFSGGLSFFPVQLSNFTELGFPDHPQICIHTGIQLALVRLESIPNLGIFPR